MEQHPSITSAFRKNPSENLSKKFTEFVENVSIVAILRKHIECNQTKIRLKILHRDLRIILATAKIKKDENIKMRAVRTCMT